MINSEHGLLTLAEMRNETADTKSFFFSHSTEKPYFKPGQFVNIGVTIEGNTFYRSYSISSLPEDNLIQLTIKRVTGGIVSNWMIDHLNIGDQVSFHGISGSFNIIDCPFRENILLISAGCGITPVMSMARHLLSHENDHVKSIRFIHCARDEDNILYFNELRDINNRSGKFSLIFYLSQPKEELGNLVREGRLNPDSLDALTKESCNDSSIYLCGPDEFMKMVKTQVDASGFNMNNFHMESFSSGCEEPSANPDLSEDKTHIVSIPDFALEKEVPEGKILLEVFEENSIPVIAACRSGICGSCKCKVQTGKVQFTVDAIANGALTKEEVEEGYTLACSSRIIEDVIVTLN